MFYDSFTHMSCGWEVISQVWLTVVLCHVFPNTPEANVGLFTWWLQDSKYSKKEGKSQCSHAFHLYCAIFANVLFAQASHVANA